MEFSNGSIGRAMDIAALDLAPLESQATGNTFETEIETIRAVEAASSLGSKAAADRYAAFLELIPGLIAQEAVNLEGDQPASGRSKHIPRRARR